MDAPNHDPRVDRPGPEEIWRTWLISGARGHPIDRRRLQGAHRGLKEALADGGEVETLRRPWRDFSRAMHRQSVNEAMGRLTARERVVVTMAYFAGFSNTEIADELGMTARGVQRSLRRALDRLSDAMEHGRRIALGFVAALAGGRLARWLTDHASAAGTQAVAAAAVAGAIAITPAGLATTGPARADAQPPFAAASAVAAPAPTSASAPAPPSASAPGLTSAVSAPAAPHLSAPKVTLPAIAIPTSLRKISKTLKPAL